MLNRFWAAALACLIATAAAADPPPTSAPAYRLGVSLQPTAIYKADGSLWDPPSASTPNPYPNSDYAKDGTDGSGTNPGTGLRGWLSGIYARLSGVLSVQPAGLTRSRTVCTLPAYASGGNVVCTDASGAQTTTACSANTACLVAAANASRKVAFFMARSAGVTVDVGYAASVAPGTGIGIDGPATSGGQGGSFDESPAHVGAYYAASASPATLVIVQGQ